MTLKSADVYENLSTHKNSFKILVLNRLTIFVMLVGGSQFAVNLNI